MSIEETKEAIRVMQAFVDGKKVEYQISDGTWLVGLTPSWNWPSTRYRIKPTPVQCDGGGEMISELESAKQRIRLLIAERDTARRQADQQYKLREEFRELLGTDDVEHGVAVVREMKERIKRLEEELERTKQDRNAIAKKTREPLLLKLDRAAERIKRLEESLDEVYHAGRVGASLRANKAWNKAKEAKP